MKITATRKDDILRERSEYDSKMQKLRDRKHETEEAYQSAQFAAKKEIERRISDLIGPTSLNLQVRASSDYNWQSDAIVKYTWDITINANDSNKFSKDVALAWNWDVKLNSKGEVVKDSGSWSGLKAVTPDQIADLEESVRVIKILNNIDWEPVLSSDIVKFEDYFDEENAVALRNMEKERPKFEDDLLAADLEELIGHNVAIQLGQDPYWKGKVWILPTRLTDKFIMGYIFPDFYITSYNYTMDQIKAKADERRTSRNNIVVRDGELVKVLLGHDANPEEV